MVGGTAGRRRTSCGPRVAAAAVGSPHPPPRPAPRSPAPPAPGSAPPQGSLALSGSLSGGVAAGLPLGQLCRHRGHLGQLRRAGLNCKSASAEGCEGRPRLLEDDEGLLVAQLGDELQPRPLQA